MPQNLVVMLGGFGASALVQQNKLFPNRRIWINRVELGINGLDNLDLAPDGLAPGPLAGNPLLPAGVVSEAGYAPLFQQLLQDGWNLTYFDYDWRHSIVYSALKLQAYLLTLDPLQDFYILAHSEGGLVARLAAPSYIAARGATHWKRTVYLGVPHGGSYWPAACLAGWNPPLTPSLQCALYAGVSLRQLFEPLAGGGSLRERVNSVLADMPALYEMLPSRYGAYASLDQNASALYKVANYVQWNTSVTQTDLDAGDAVQKSLDQSLALARVPEVCVVGVGTPTPYNLFDAAQLPNSTGYLSDTEGDGTVEADRARLVGTSYLELTADHISVVNGSAIRARVTDLLLNGLGADSTSLTPPTYAATSLKNQAVTWSPEPTLATIAIPWKQTALDP